MIHYMTTQGVGDAWVGNELRVLAQSGIAFRLNALNRPANTYFIADDVAELDAATCYVYPLSTLKLLGAVLAAPFRFGSRFFCALWNALTGERESLRIRLLSLWHLGVACHWAAHLRGNEISHIHSQWIHSGGTVAMYAAWLLGKPFSFTGHAADLFRERAALRDKIKRARFIICISTFHRDFYLENGANAEQLVIAYCGIDTSHFTPIPRTRDVRGPFRIVSSGRLVEKKGFPVLIKACRILKDRGVPFTCVIGGSGPDDAMLREQIAQARLEDDITLTGEALKQEDIPTFMAEGDVYCLPCVWASDNDVDGLPQMLMEAMACGLPAISTQLVGIPDLVVHEDTGLLVAPGDPAALADALERLAADPELAEKLSHRGRVHVVTKFDLPASLDPLVSRFRTALEKTT